MFATTRVFAPLLVLFAAFAVADEPKTDLDNFQGTWSVSNYEQDGQVLPPEAIKPLRVLFDRDRYEVKRNDQIEEHGTIKVDSTKKPKRIEFKIVKGEGAGETQLGIYELEGDTLKFCVSIPPGSKERPTTIESKEGSNTLLMVLKRKKD
jgi:uncharacterized protein (TIGR03067 family)